MEGRDARIGLNEAVFREVNERIETLAQTFDLGSERLDFICECGDASCVERIHMTHAEFEELRSDSHHFAVYPGHVIADVERVVAQRAGYEVVEKVEPLPRLIAETTDPRSD
jgi:uncharacterized protein with von Willebrand factor type A (vWA) domain